MAAHKVVQVLQSFLEAVDVSDKAPINFDSKIDNVCSMTSEPTPRVFLEAGFQAWFAYFLADQAAHPIIQDIHKLTSEDVQSVTTGLSQVQAPESVKQLYQHLFI